MGEWATDKIAELEEELAEAKARAEEADDDLDRALGTDLRQGEAPVDAIGRIRRERDEALARIKPSWQVAEDVKELRGVIDDQCFTGGLRDRKATAALTRLAAKAQGYEAVVADNAVLYKQLRVAQDPHAIGCFRPRGAMGQMVRPCPCGADVVVGSDRPGASLLEQHRKEVAQARNEGLEEAAEHLRGATKDAARLAREIRAMKACTDGSCARCRSGEPCR